LAFSWAIKNHVGVQFPCPGLNTTIHILLTITLYFRVIITYFRISDSSKWVIFTKLSICILIILYLSINIFLTNYTSTHNATYLLSPSHFHYVLAIYGHQQVFFCLKVFPCVEYPTSSIT
jgi:hypothetical protein